MKIFNPKTLIVCLLMGFGCVSLHAQSASTDKTPPPNPDQAKQELLQQQEISPYENAKHERLERIANNDLTPEMRASLEAEKIRHAKEKRLALVEALRTKALSTGEPTGKYDSEINALKEDLQ